MSYLPFTPAPIADLWYGTSGPRNARVVVVAESWGGQEAYEKVPLVGESGKEFNRMLAEAGFKREEIFCTNCFAAQPPSNDAWRFFETTSSGASKWKGLQPTNWARSELRRLFRQLNTIRPEIVIAAGNYALWALTEEGLVSFSSESTGDGATVLVPTGILSWRGSMLVSGAEEIAGCKILPVIHPAGILRAWYQRAVTVHDLQARIPLALCGDWEPTPPPTIHEMPDFAIANSVLDNWIAHAASGNLLRLSHDIETARGIITCMAFADGPFAAGSTALVIPLVRLLSNRAFENYWSEAEEAILTRKFCWLLTYPNVKVEGQNYNYDTQWMEVFYGITPKLDFDTMLAHHLLWPGTPKGLDYLASLYNHYYRYWKDDNKEWDGSPEGWRRHLRYNAEDALRTFECATELRTQITSQGFADLWEVEKAKNLMALEMMRRGVKIDTSRRAEMGFQLQFELQRVNEWLGKIIPQSWLLESDFAPKTSKKRWWESPKQQKDLFFDILGFPRKTSRKTGNASLDAEAIEKLRKEVPWAARLWDALESARSIGVFYNTFIKAELEPGTEPRMKCSFNTAGTETFRWSSSTNAFWRGTNLQNIPKGEERD